MYQIAAAAMQELSQSWNLLNFVAYQKASVTLYFPSVLKAQTRYMLKSEVYHSAPDSKNCFQSISKLIKIRFLMHITPRYYASTQAQTLYFSHLN